MKAVNYNDIVREKIISSIIKKENMNDDELIESINDFYLKIKDNEKLFDLVVKIIYLTSYILTFYTNYRFPDDEQTISFMSFLRSFLSIDDLKNQMNSDIFTDLCLDTISFYNSDYYIRKKMVERSLDDKDYLSSKVSLFINDVVSYGKNYDDKSIMDYYYKRLKQTSDIEVSKEDAICMGCELLIKLADDDPDNYDSLMYNIIDQYYTYNKYLLSNDKEADEYALDNVDYIENNCKSLVMHLKNNGEMLEPIIRDFIEYNLLDKKEKKKINDFYRNENLRTLTNDFYKFNYNNKLRKRLYSIFGNVDVCDDNAVDNNKEKLEFVRNSDFFDYLVRILYIDSMSFACYDYLSYPSDNDFKMEFDYMNEFNNLKEFYNEVVLDDVSLLNAINKSIYFYSLPLIEKKNIIKVLYDSKSYNSYLTKEYVHDALEFVRPISIYDATLIYNENLYYEKDVKIAKALSVSEITSLLINLEIFDEDNYDAFLYDIVKFVYGYCKYKLDNFFIENDELKKMISMIEKDLDGFLNSIKNNYDYLEKVLVLFYDYVSISDVNKKRVQIYFDKLQDMGVVKVFKKKNKNS